MMINPYMVGPNYSSLSNIELLVDYSGLAVGTTNDYGTVDGSGNVTNLKSLAPGPTGRDFASNGTAPTLSNGGIVFGGAGRLVHGTASIWNFLHYNATYANLRWTVHAVVKFGTSSDPNAVYGLLGNNGTSNANKGVALFWDDRVSFPRSNNMVCLISAGGGTNNITSAKDETIPANTFVVLTVETRFDPTVGAFRQAFFVNGYLQGVVVTVNSTTLVTTPTYNLEIGGCGNSTIPMTGTIKELVIQSAVEDGRVRDTFIRGLIQKHSIDVTATLPTVDITRTSTVYDTQNVSGKYYLATACKRNPVRPWILTKCYRVDDDHVGAGDSIWVYQKSVNNGVTWSSPTTFIDPPIGLAPMDGGGGYDHLGRLHIFTDVRPYVAGVVSGASTIYHYYSDDDGDTWSYQDLAAVIPNDGLIGSVAYGNMIENGIDTLMFPFYKVTDWGDLTQSSNYILRSTDRGATWTAITVRSPAATYINEMTIMAASSTDIICIARNEATLEWSASTSSDNGLTWSAFSDASFGESLTTAGPGRLTKFKIDNTDVIAYWYTNRVATPLTKVVYGLASAIASSGYSGFTLGTKTTILNTGRRLHYFDVSHPMGNFNAIASGAYEQASIDLSDNDHITLSVLSTHYSTVKTALGL